MISFADSQTRWGRLQRLTLLVTLSVAGGAASAQATDPFLRSAPSVVIPSLAPSGPAVSTPVASSRLPAFGPPRASTSGSVTRVVFDLPAGLSYTLTPTFSGLRLDVRGVVAQPLQQGSLGAMVSGYQLTPVEGGAQALLSTPFPLGLQTGWSATEATIATGGRVLILQLGSTVAGGAGASVRGAVQAVASPSAAPTDPPPGRTVLPTPTADQLPPGDAVTPQPAALPEATPPLAPSPAVRQTAGVVPGTLPPQASVAAPRIGKNPGLTRVVLDLPPGTGYRVTLLPLGLRLDLTGVSAPVQSAQAISPELRGWSYTAGLTGVAVTLTTATPLSQRNGWRMVLLPPTEGSTLSRLALDFSPALADLSPLGGKAVARLVSSRSGLLAFSGTPNLPRVVLDPGHGGNDPGAIGSVVEKQVTLDVARRVRSMLQPAGVDVLMTRDGDVALNADKATDLGLRAALGTGRAQLFVSIHVNSTESRSALLGYGVETWWNRNNPSSQALAGDLQRDVIDSTAAYSRGLKNNKSLAVLRLSHIPAALVEIGYASHPIDGQNLQDTNYLDRVAFGIASGIRDALQDGLGADWR